MYDENHTDVKRYQIILSLCPGDSRTEVYDFTGQQFKDWYDYTVNERPGLYQAKIIGFTIIKQQ